MKALSFKVVAACGGLLGFVLTGCMSSSGPSVVQEPVANIDGMQVIGQVEYVTVLPINYRYNARIDTGATTCSMSALDLEQFERDGQKWVRFRLPVPGTTGKKMEKSELLEYPISRVASIKRHGAEHQMRPAVMMKVRLGDFEGLVEFTLTDRSKYEFPILVGRNLLEGHAVVDASKSYLMEK